MKQNIAEYYMDSFIDFKNLEHKIVACAISHVLNDGDEYIKDTINNNEVPIPKVVSLGIAICNPDDNYSKIVGKRMAYNKAINNLSNPVLYAPNLGIINSTLIKGLLKQEVNYIKNNPGLMIKGYNDSEKKYNSIQALKEEYNNMDSIDKQIIDKILNGANLDKYIKISKALK